MAWEGRSRRGRAQQCCCIPAGFLGRHRAFLCPAESRVTLEPHSQESPSMQTSPWRKEPLPFVSPQGRSHPYSKLYRWETILQAKLFTSWLQLSQGHGVLLPLVRSLDLLHQDSGLQDLGEALLPSRSEGCGQTQPGRTAQPLPLGRSWPLPPPLAALPSRQRWESCRRGQPRKRCRNS